MMCAMNDTVRRFVELCDLYARHTGRRVSTVSRYATGSGETIARLCRGRTITIRRLERAIRYLSENWPENADWPAGTPRPPASETANPNRPPI